MSEISPSLQPTDSQNELPSLQKRARIWLTMTILSIPGIMIPPLIGIAGTVSGMVSAYDEIERTGGGNPEMLAGDISTSLITTVFGIVISALFGVLFLVSLPLWLVTLNKIKNSPENVQA